MREYWDERARRNAMWYVDTSLDYGEPDEAQFFDTGRKVVAEALDDAPASPAERHLAVEIGCGLGRICAALRERFDEVVGLDISAEMIERARTMVTTPGVRFEVGSGSSLAPLTDASADLVLSFTVFQHIPDPEVIEAYLADAGRVLKPGGLLVFQWNNTPGERRWALRRSALTWLQRIGVGRDRFGRNAPEFLGSRLSIPRVRAALDRAGLDLQATRGDGTLFTWAWATRR